MVDVFSAPRPIFEAASRMFKFQKPIVVPPKPLRTWQDKLKYYMVELAEDADKQFDRLVFKHKVDWHSVAGAGTALLLPTALMKKLAGKKVSGWAVAADVVSLIPIGRAFKAVKAASFGEKEAGLKLVGRLASKAAKEDVKLSIQAIKRMARRPLPLPIRRIGRIRRRWLLAGAVGVLTATALVSSKEPTHAKPIKRPIRPRFTPTEWAIHRGIEAPEVMEKEVGGKEKLKAMERRVERKVGEGGVERAVKKRLLMFHGALRPPRRRWLPPPVPVPVPRRREPPPRRRWLPPPVPVPVPRRREPPPRRRVSSKPHPPQPQRFDELVFGSLGALVGVLIMRILG